MLVPVAEKKSTKSRDNDIRLLFKPEPTPYELLPTSGSNIYAVPEQTVTSYWLLGTVERVSSFEEETTSPTASGELNRASVSVEETTAQPVSFSDPGMTALEAAAEASNVYDVSPFMRAYKDIDWGTRPPDDFALAVRLAINAGAHPVARELAMIGANRYPDHTELQKMAHILAPPVVKVASGKANTSWKANRAWLKDHWNEYRGKWVALSDGQLLGVADTFDDLVNQVGDLKNSGILVTAVG